MKDGAKKRAERKPAGADRPDPFGFTAIVQKAKTVLNCYGGHPIVRDGDCRKKKVWGHKPQPPVFLSLLCRFLEQKNGENGAASPFPMQSP